MDRGAPPAGAALARRLPQHPAPRDRAKHLAQYTGTAKDAVVFTGELGAGLDRSHWNVVWRKARLQVGRPDLRFHDLRHTGNTLAAATGASTRELMVRMGHASPRAALIYQHATRERDEAIAAALGELMTSTRVIALKPPGVADADEQSTGGGAS